MSDDLVVLLKEFASKQRCQQCVFAAECRRKECVLYRAAYTISMQEREIKYLNGIISRVVGA